VRPGAAPVRRSPAERIVGPAQASLLDVVDNVLNKGVVLTGELTLALADVDLIYARLSVLLSAVDRVLPEAAAASGRPRPARRPGRPRATGRP
jgi:hypothetical protein